MPSQLDIALGVVDTIHGASVADPYRWLEDRKAKRTEEWIAGQRIRFEQYITQLGPLDRLRMRVAEFVDVETIDEIAHVHNQYFYRRRVDGQEQPSIFVMGEAPHSERLLVDSSGCGPFTSAGLYRISTDGALLAYQLKQGGEHTKAIYVVDVLTGRAFPDYLDRGLARGFVFRQWNDGFYYCHELEEYEESTVTDHKVLFHRFGTPAEDDIVVLALPRSQSSKLALKSDRETLYVIYYREQGGAGFVDFYLASQAEDDNWSRVCSAVPAPFGPFCYRGRLFAQRYQHTPNGEIVELSATTGQAICVVVPEWDVPIKQYVRVENCFYVSYLVGTQTTIRVWSMDGEYLGTLPLDETYTWILLPRYTTDVDEFFLQRESFTTPPALVCYQPQKKHLFIWSQRRAPLTRTPFSVHKLKYLSKDNTEIAISIVGPENPSLLGDRPMIMTAYGGFGLTLTPQFSAFVTVMMELGFLFAVPEIRGGQERGQEWHEAARGRKRQVAFDDFIAAAEWLCSTGYTSPQKLAAFGGSNSGILIGAAITQRPALFRAVLCMAPLLDMVRYHLFDRARIWATEYGSADDPDDFQALLAYSPYHNVRDDINYPSILFVSGDRDTRCNPAHARKMAALLQNRNAQKNCVLLDHTAERGHAPTMPMSFRVDALTHRIAFLCHELGVEVWNDPVNS